MNARTEGGARHKILQEAIGIVYREGVGRITMRGLAEKLGYSPATIYLHFSGKDELEREIALHGFRRLAECVTPALEMDDPRAALRRVFLCYIEFGLESPELYRLMFQDMRALREIGLGEDPLLLKLFEGIRNIYERGIAKGVFRSCDPNIETAVGWAMVHGLVQLAASRRLPSPMVLVHEFAPLRDALIEDRLRSLSP
jgi:AcrR family transcriptional regulator